MFKKLSLFLIIVISLVFNLQVGLAHQYEHNNHGHEHNNHGHEQEASIDCQECKFVNSISQAKNSEDKEINLSLIENFQVFFQKKNYIASRFVLYQSRAP